MWEIYKGIEKIEKGSFQGTTTKDRNDINQHGEGNKIIDNNTVCCLFTLLFAWYSSATGLEVIKLFSCSTQLSTNFQLLIKTKTTTNEDNHSTSYSESEPNHRDK